MTHRRHVIQAAASLPLIGLMPGRLWAASPTPACGGEAAPTLAQMAGPFVRNEVPERQQLREPGMPGLPLRLSGSVRDTDCQPLRDVVLTFWQANAAGDYDLQGGQLYGRQRSAEGRYQLGTVVPGRYPGRVRHLHVALHDASDRLRLTTQLYFPGERDNRRDFLFNPALLMAYAETAEQADARFDFVLA